MPKCANTSKGNFHRKSKEEFIRESRNTHGELYDYSKFVYINNVTKGKIICSKHGTFWKTPNAHLSKQEGCQYCINTTQSNGEERILDILSKLELNFIRQKTFKNCVDIRVLPFDFFLPEYNLLIEYDGIQHFEPVDYFGGKASFYDRVRKDKIKEQFAYGEHIKLLRIPYFEFDNIENIIKKTLEI